VSKPVRIQRKRTKGWKMPPNTVSVTRPGKWGNPFLKGMGAVSAAHAVEVYRDWLNGPGAPVKAAAASELRGKNLACFCKVGSPCHADVLLDLANSEDAGA